jgi:hypothetical protein
MYRRKERERRESHSVRKRNKREIYRKKENERAMSTVECIQSKKACYEVVIHSEAKPKKRGSSDAECIQSEPPPKPPYSQENQQERDRQEEKESQQ